MKTKNLIFLLNSVKTKANLDAKIYSKEEIDLAYKHGLIPLLYKSCQTPQLKPHYTLIVQRNMQMTMHLIALLKVLQKENISALSFKGVVLAHLAYQNISLRQFGDLDILIQDKDKDKIIECMQKYGYKPEIILKQSTQAYFLKSVNVMGFYTPDNSTLIEIHWQLLSKNYAISWDENLLWKDTIETSIFNQKVQTLNFEQQLLYLCLHSAKHLFSRLQWLCDIDHTLRSQEYIKWENLVQHADKLKIRRIFLLNLSLCHSKLDLPLPTFIHQLIKEDKQIKNIQSQVFYSQSFILFLKMRETYKDKFLFIYYGIFATKFDDFKYIQLPSYLGLLYLFIRPWRLLRKYFTTISSKMPFSKR